MCLTLPGTLESASNTTVRSRVESKRSWGRFSRHRKTIPLSDGLMLSSSGGSSFRTALAESAAVFPSNALREHFIQDRAETEHIRMRVNARAPQLLGRHVPRSSHHLARNGRARPEIQDLDHSIVRDEYVLRLQVAMYDAACMRRCSGARLPERRAEFGLPAAPMPRTPIRFHCLSQIQPG